MLHVKYAIQIKIKMSLIDKLKKEKTEELMCLEIEKHSAKRIINKVYSPKGIFTMQPIEINSIIKYYQKGKYSKEEFKYYLNLFEN